MTLFFLKKNTTLEGTFTKFTFYKIWGKSGCESDEVCNKWTKTFSLIFKACNPINKPVINVLQSMLMTDKAWNCVQTKINAILLKAGFLKIAEVRKPNVVEKTINITHAVASISEEWRLISNALQVVSLKTIQDFIEIEHNVEIMGT